MKVYLEPGDEVYAECRLTLESNGEDGHWYKLLLDSVLDGAQITTYITNEEEGIAVERGCLIDDNGKLYYEEDDLEDV